MGPTCSSLTDMRRGRVDAAAAEKMETAESERPADRAEVLLWSEQMMNLRRTVRSLSEKQADEAAVPLGSGQSANQ